MLWINIAEVDIILYLTLQSMTLTLFSQKFIMMKLFTLLTLIYGSYRDLSSPREAP